MRKSGGEPMSCGYSPTPPAACAWSAHSPSKPTKTGSKPTATSIWTNCASRRKPNYAKPHDQHQDRKSTRLTPVTNAHLVCRLLLEKKKKKKKVNESYSHTHHTTKQLANQYFKQHTSPTRM